MQFPQFRKYKNGKSYFKIDSENTFTEYKLLGENIEMYEFEAKILPDRNYITDMLTDFEPYWDKIDEVDFTEFLTLHNSMN